MGPWGRELFEAVLKSGVEETDRRLAASCLPNLSPDVIAKPPKKSAELPPASIYHEEGAVAVMRHNWNRNDERIAVLFPQRTCEIELVASGRVALSGAWRFEISQQGRPLQPESDWKPSCWYSDEDVDYLELEIELTAGVKLERQIVLAREDRFLLLADAVMSPERGNLEYRGILPLAPQVEFRGAEESREGFLLHFPRSISIEDRPGTRLRVSEECGKSAASGILACASGFDNRRPNVSNATAGSIHGRGAEESRVALQAAYRPLAQAMPLGMPEWRAEQHPGDLKPIAEGLELRQATEGQRLFAPLFIDLDRSRFRRRMTWRRITVAESLAPVPSDVAVGFRIAIGDQQWLIYRSLAASGNRTLLGHNLATESLIARFGKDGEVTSIVEIE